MQIPKPTDDDRTFFRAVVQDDRVGVDPHVEVKPMFGNLGAFVNGNMFAGLFGGDVGVRLSAVDADRLIALGGGSFGPTERPMAAYVALPPSVRQSETESRAWVTKAYEHVAAMPPKASKPSKAAAKASGA